MAEGKPTLSSSLVLVADTFTVVSAGVDLVGAAIRQALGEPIDPADLQPRFQQPVAQRYWFPSRVLFMIFVVERFAITPMLLTSSWWNWRQSWSTSVTLLALE